MKVKETIKNKYEECKEKISNIDDWRKGFTLGAMIGIGGVLINQSLNSKVIKESFVNGYMSGIVDVLNNKVNVMELKITKN